MILSNRASFKRSEDRKSYRLKNWDYSWGASYFVTICTHERQHFFGEIKSGKMKLSPLDAIADVLWSEIKHHIKNVKLDNHVVMPNHIHGIITLQTTIPSPPYKDNLGALRFQNQGRNSVVGTRQPCPYTTHALSLNRTTGNHPKPIIVGRATCDSNTGRGGRISLRATCCTVPGWYLQR